MGEQQTTPWKAVHGRKLIQFTGEILKAEVNAERGRVLFEETPRLRELRVDPSFDNRHECNANFPAVQADVVLMLRGCHNLRSVPVRALVNRMICPVCMPKCSTT